ncbi:LacI family DNA-binding transcriptional regulator [Clostridium folliculivorans]|uniref:LacI family transcriptional regulator n=1 Tax=Clostridium folliculivorans TaxID=2886038 RepID=A0A9W6D994_9CLOT|nr:LacI family DNA-binding transcriptional regulator [Clostridium folliculivorans]GKU23463.1 LacI family transcriptional regulator [Clostridium folliculivorans]GKU29579.1 LacI family transcriptional regulator [Clostridium folliculivorans]
MATIKDVAEIAGVTVTTVSRVLNNRGYISDSTREKVNAAMKELNYQPNELARSLFRKKSNIIGLIVPDVAHPFFAKLTSYIEAYAYAAGYKVLLCNSYQDATKEKDYVEMLKGNQVDGIIMGSHTLETSDYLTPTLPIVAIDRDFSNNIPFITSDNYAGGLIATNLLLDKGCKKLAHISGPLELSTPANKRYEAFMNTVLERKAQYVVEQAKLDVYESYKKLARKIFHKHPDIDGVFASSDMIAAAMMQVSQELGKEVPRDIKVIGYDDVEVASLMAIPLTTIKQPIDEMAQLAIKLLLDQMEGKKVTVENVLPVKLIERKST